MVFTCIVASLACTSCTSSQLVTIVEDSPLVISNLIGGDYTEMVTYPVGYTLDHQRKTVCVTAYNKSSVITNISVYMYGHDSWN